MVFVFASVDFSDPKAALDISKLRCALNQLEDTIIFRLIERAQFPLNKEIYEPGAISIPNFNRSFLEFFLYQTESVNALVRRYESPTEYPFIQNLPEAILPPLNVPEILHKNNVTVNREILEFYTNKIVNALCTPGKQDSTFGSSAIADVECLQIISFRVHLGKFVAESKYRNERSKFDPLIRKRAAEAIEKLITVPAVEEQVLERIALKARTYRNRTCDENRINVDAIISVYREHIIPLTKKVEVEYLLQRLN